MHGLSIIGLALAVSLDSFSVGTAYGLKKTKIPLCSVLIIAACSACVLFLAMNFGKSLESLLSQNAARATGGWLLVALGFAALLHYFVSGRELSREMIHVRIRPLGILIQILKDPEQADADHSGTISPAEAFVLGCALSFDAFGAGIAAAFVEYSALFTACLVACMSGLFLWGGKTFGFHFSESGWLKKVSFVPGILLILIGLSRMK
ncbi:MAG TPA: sporulation membrane protein YtaF [Bacillales bacterium]|nr:sporulation membrane protein YtaF [Bacillales bacterium]